MVGTPMPPMRLYDVQIKRCIKSGQVMGAIVPREDFRYDGNCTKVDEKKGLFYADATRITRSAAKQKWPKKKDVIDAAPVWMPGTNDSGQEKQQRDKLRWQQRTTPGDKETEEIEVIECYAKVAYFSDVAEWVQVCVTGYPAAEGAENGILAIEKWGGGLPYVALTPNSMPHRFRGRSAFDDIYHIQRVKTALLRKHNDNLYLHVNPQKVVDENAIINKDALEDNDIGGTIYSNGPPANAVVPLQIPYVGDKVFAALEYYDMVTEKRTGVSRSTLALDTDTLQYQTKAAVDATRDTKFSKIETYARNLAECGGLKELFSKILKLVVQNQKSIKKIKIRGEWVTMDPRGWDVDMKCSINVGLGAGSRDADLAVLGGIAQKQELAISALQDPFNEICNVGHAFDTYRKMVDAGGLQNAEQFFPVIPQEKIAEIRAQRAQNPPPNPEMVKVQGALALEDKKIASDQQRDQNRAVLDQRKSDADARKELVQAQADIATQNRKTEAEIAIKEREAALKERLALLEHELKVLESEQTRALKREEHMMRRQEMAAQAEADEPEVAEAKAVVSKRRQVEGAAENERRGAERQRRDQENAQRDAMNQQTMMALAQAMGRMAEVMMMPDEIVRDPKTGRAMGKRKKVS